MAFSKRKIKLTNVAKGILVTIVIMGALGSGLYMIFQNKMNACEMELNALKKDLFKSVFMSKGYILAGAVINENDFYLADIYSSIDQSQYITKEDIGKVLIVDVKANVPILETMVREEMIQNDLREEELNMFLLPSNLAKNQFVDVRIGFPNGEDYIVLSKKKIQDVMLQNNTIWLWINEKEILMLSSAIVDAYLHKGSKLYTVTYIEPATQDQAILNYPVNNDVLKVIQNNPNILDEAKQSLSEEARNLLNERLKEISDTEISSVESGVTKEASSRETKIAKEQEIIKQENHDVTIMPEASPEEKSLMEKGEIESETFY